jgi:hypothetical protein
MNDDNPPFCWSRAAQAGLTFRRVIAVQAGSRR